MEFNFKLQHSLRDVMHDPASGDKLMCCSRSVRDAVVPKGVSVIGERAFLGCKSLTSVSLPEGVTKIEASAFFNCENLENVNIPEGVTEIGADAFCGCKGLTEIVLPAGVKTIEAMAFQNCANLKSVTLPDSVRSIYKDTFCCAITASLGSYAAWYAGKMDLPFEQQLEPGDGSTAAWPHIVDPKLAVDSARQTILFGEEGEDRRRSLESAWHSFPHEISNWTVFCQPEEPSSEKSGGPKPNKKRLVETSRFLLQ